MNYKVIFHPGVINLTQKEGYHNAIVTTNALIVLVSVKLGVNVDSYERVRNDQELKRMIISFFLSASSLYIYVFFGL